MTKKGEKKTAANTNAKKAPKQGTLPADGMARKRIDELDAAAEAYRAARNKRQDHTKIEIEKAAVLLAVARKYGISVYVYEDEEGDEGRLGRVLDLLRLRLGVLDLVDLDVFAE